MTGGCRKRVANPGALLYNVSVYLSAIPVCEGELPVTPVYLDNSATTVVCKPAADKAYAVMTELYGNPSSLHTLGFAAEQELDAARQAVAALMGVPSEGVVFTSGGTEANNLAVLGSVAAHPRAGKHIVTTAVEHSSVRECCDRLEREGYTVTRLIPAADGTLTAGQIAEACRPDTALVAELAHQTLDKGENS